MMNPYLFVYGTLKNDAQNEVARFLRDHATFLGEGIMAGRMFDLGEYPGAVFIENGGEQVSGHVFKMTEPALVLKVLDEYEGIGSEFPEPHEYVRQVVPVSFRQEVLNCWVYLYNL